MTVEALPRIQQTYIAPDERTGRNKLLTNIACISALLGTGLLLAPFFSALSMAAGLIAGCTIVVLSLYSVGYLTTIDSDKDLSKAAYKGDLCKVKFLLFLGANPNVSDAENDVVTPLIGATINGSNPEIIDRLMKAGANPEIRIGGMTALNFAIPAHHEQAVEMLLKHGANSNHPIPCLQAAINYRNQFVNEAYDHPSEGDTRTREERKLDAARIVELLEAHNAH